MQNLSWRKEEVAALDEIAYLSPRFRGAVTYDNLAQRLNKKCVGPKPTLERWRLNKKDGEDEFNERMVRDQIGRQVELGHYPLANWSTQEYKEKMKRELEQMHVDGPLSKKKIIPYNFHQRVDGEGSLSAQENGGPSRVGGLNPDQEPVYMELGGSSQPRTKKKGKKVDWIKDERNYLLDHALELRRFGGYKSYGVMAAELNSLVDAGILEPRRDRDGPEFSEGMVGDQVLRMEAEKIMPERALPLSKMRNPDSEKDLEMYGNKTVSARVVKQQRAKWKKLDAGKDQSTHGGVTLGMRGPSGNKPRRGAGKQVEGRSEPYPQRASISGPSGISKTQHRARAGAGMSGLARGISMLNPYQPPDLPQASAPAQAGPAAHRIQQGPEIRESDPQSHDGKVSRCRSSLHPRQPPQAQAQPQDPLPQMSLISSPPPSAQRPVPAQPSRPPLPSMHYPVPSPSSSGPAPNLDNAQVASQPSNSQHTDPSHSIQQPFESTIHEKYVRPHLSIHDNKNEKGFLKSLF
ncbi:hypothetical protein V8E51_000430 [Hyaloscypha variabilis]|jgi:hypothetical protein